MSRPDTQQPRVSRHVNPAWPMRSGGLSYATRIEFINTALSTLTDRISLFFNWISVLPVLSFGGTWRTEFLGYFFPVCSWKHSKPYFLAVHCKQSERCNQITWAPTSEGCSSGRAWNYERKEKQNRLWLFSSLPHLVFIPSKSTTYSMNVKSPLGILTSLYFKNSIMKGQLHIITSHWHQLHKCVDIWHDSEFTLGQDITCFWTIKDIICNNSSLKRLNLCYTFCWLVHLHHQKWFLQH